MGGESIAARPPQEEAHGVGSLLSVNVGFTKHVPWQGKTIFTGVCKAPVAGRRRVGRRNVDGDGQGDLASHAGELRAVLVWHIAAVRWTSVAASVPGLAQARDVPVRWSCRTGVRHTGDTTLVAGGLHSSAEPVEPPADGSAPICCSHPRDEVVLDL
jgi:hypothetical protein